MAEVRIPRRITGWAHEVRGVLRDPVLAVWCLFVFLIPFYLFPSGLPQPGDILVIPLVIIALRSWNGRLDRRIRRPLSTLIAFTLWVILIDWGWAVFEGNFGLYGPDTFLLFPIYYIYNALVFLVVCVLYHRYGARFLLLTVNIVFLTVVVQAAASVITYRGSGHRGVGFFNNPNQLGFFVLVSASIIALAKGRLAFSSGKIGFGLTLCFYLALLSASRAAVIGTGVLFALTVITSPKRLAIVGIVAVGLIAVGGPLLNDAVDRTQQRLAEQRYPQFNFFQERGYDRILGNKEYWLLGAGEGGTNRFLETTIIGGTEIHSSLGTIFFCYGIVGITLFVVFLFRVVERASLRTIVILLLTLSYTVAHQGLRATLVWILFALLVCIKLLPRAGGAAATPPRLPSPPSPPRVSP